MENIIAAIKKYDKIIIHRHIRPDPDALGSQGALKEIIKHSFPRKQVYIVGEDDPSFSFLIKMDKIDDSSYDGALVIICDTANTDRIDDGRYQTGDKIIKIDHHPNVDPYGDLLYVDTSASSTSELIYELSLQGESHGLKMNCEAARLLYAGIVGDTGRFLFPNTTGKTFKYVSELVNYNFDRTEIYNGLYSVEENIVKLSGHIMQHATLTSSGMCNIKLTKEILAKFAVKPLETGQLVNVISDIKGIKAWVLFIEEEDLIRVRLRSKGPVINNIAAKYNGGGHPLAAGATITTWEEAELVIADLEAACATYNVNN